MTTKKEPTTAELFARVVEALKSLDSYEEYNENATEYRAESAREAVALLEKQFARAKADNAALLRVASCEEYHLHNGTCPDETQPASRDPECPVCRALLAPHPGDALREYIRALEAVRTAVEPTRRLTELLLESAFAHYATETERALLTACAQADALQKGAPERMPHASASRPPLADHLAPPYWVRVSETVCSDLTLPLRCECGWSGTLDDSFRGPPHGSLGVSGRRLYAQCPACSADATKLWLPSPRADLYRRVEHLETIVGQLTRGER